MGDGILLLYHTLPYITQYFKPILYFLDECFGPRQIITEKMRRDLEYRISIQDAGAPWLHKPSSAWLASSYVSATGIYRKRSLLKADDL